MVWVLFVCYLQYVSSILSAACINHLPLLLKEMYGFDKKNVKVGKDQEKAQSEKDSHSKNRGGEKPN